MPSINRKQIASKSEKVIQKPPKRKDVQMTEVHKEVKEVASTTILMPTKTRSEAICKNPHKTTTYERPVN